MTIKKQQVDWKIVCTAIVAIAALEGVAMVMGFNGSLLRIVLVAIAALAGLTLPTPQILKAK